jgi:hypothetical protein
MYQRVAAVALLVAGTTLGAVGAVTGLGCRGQSSGSSTQTAGPSGPVWFEDITAASGLQFVHDAGPVETYLMPQITGSGAALFDYDNDGRLDIYLIQNAGPNSRSTNRLFHQLPDGRFEDVSAGSGLDIAGFGMGVAVGDINNDGWPDVLVTMYGGCRLFLNNGNGTFTDVTKESGIDNTLWGCSAAFFDYDRDGWLDLVIVNYLAYDPTVQCIDDQGKDYCHPSSFPGLVTKLYHNLGPIPGAAPGHVRFEDVTWKAGLGKDLGHALGVVCVDLDGDGWPDIFVAHDSLPNRLWINHRDGTFTEEAFSRGVAVNSVGQPQANMGIALGDLNGDGLADLFVTHLTQETNTLWQQLTPGFFEDRTATAGLTRTQWRGTGFGTVAIDFDHDGAIDLAVVNGRITKLRGKPKSWTNGSLDAYWSLYGERNQLFANDGEGRFHDVSLDNEPFCGSVNVARGLACGDIDGDGAIDLLVTTIAGPARLYRNVAPKEGRHWLMVRAIDPSLKRDAYGAEIRVEAGGRAFLGFINPAHSYLCSNDPRAHFGLGAASRVDALHVQWPDGRRERFPAVGADQVLVIKKGTGQDEGPLKTLQPASKK